jgi:hypothetical protein
MGPGSIVSVAGDTSGMPQVYHSRSPCVTSINVPFRFSGRWREVSYISIRIAKTRTPADTASANKYLFISYSFLVLTFSYLTRLEALFKAPTPADDS